MKSKPKRRTTPIKPDEPIKVTFADAWGNIVDTVTTNFNAISQNAQAVSEYNQAAVNAAIVNAQIEAEERKRQQTAVYGIAAIIVVFSFILILKKSK